MPLRRIAVSLIATSPVWPLATTIILVFLYVQATHTGISTDESRRLIVAWGLGALVWTIAAIASAPTTCARQANTSEFSTLRQKATLLDGWAASGTGATADPAIQELEVQIAAVANQLTDPGGEFKWVSGFGYLDVWRILHQVEGELLYRLDTQACLDEGKFDMGRLTGSNIDAAATYATQAKDAVGVLSAVLSPSPSAAGGPSGPTPAAVTAAKHDLKGVRIAINEYRDEMRRSILAAVRNLQLTFLLSAFSTALLLSLAVLQFTHTGSGRTSVESAIWLFSAGAVVSVAVHLYLTSQQNTLVEDYGLSRARLFAAPLLAGLIGLLGVYVTVITPGYLNGLLPAATPPGLPASAVPAATTPTPAIPTSGTQATTGSSGGQPDLRTPQPRQLAGIFDVVDYPLEVVIAILFALSPGLIIGRLTQQSEQNKANLASTQSANYGTPGK